MHHLFTWVWNHVTAGAWRFEEELWNVMNSAAGRGRGWAENLPT